MTTVPVITLGALSWQPSPSALLAIVLLLGVFAITLQRARARLAGAAALRRRSVLTLNLLALLAMILILEPPRWESPATRQVILVTEGATELPPAGMNYAIGDGGALDNAELRKLRTAGQLLLQSPDVNTLEVLGHGLDESQWESLPASLRVRWTPPAKPLIGPVDLRWPALLEFGDTLVITGELRLADADAIAVLRLIDPAGVAVATTNVAAGEAFALRALPRAPGPLVYRLQLEQDEVLLSDEPVAVYLRESAPARMLVLQSAPSFETRQLANWAADRGASLLIQSRVSRGRDLLQRVNLPEDSPEGPGAEGPGAEGLGAESLAKTDLAVIDGRRWANLDDAQRRRLLDAVRDGLGLLLLVDQEFADWLDRPEREALFGLRLSPQASGDPRWLRGEAGSELVPLPVAPWRLDLTTAQSLTLGELGDVLESRRSLGRGRIAVSRLRERHRWATAGDTSLFSRYWSRLLRELGRPQVEPRWLPADMGLRLRSGIRVPLCARADSAVPLRLHFESLALTEASQRVAAEIPAARLLPHAAGGPLQCGYGWPSTPGWHALRLLTEDGSVIDEVMLRVFHEGEWRSDRYARRQSATRERVAISDAQRPGQPVVRPLSPWWAWSLLLLALVPLWIERRLFDLD